MKFLTFSLIFLIFVSIVNCDKLKAGYSGVLSINSKCNYLGRLTNPVKPCIYESCPKCLENNQADKILRVVFTDYSLNSRINGLMTYDANICRYALRVTGLQSNKDYYWRVSVDDRRFYACLENEGYCKFTSNSEGSVFITAEPTREWYPFLRADGINSAVNPVDKIQNPTTQCTESECPQCKLDSKLASNLIKVTGDWAGLSTWTSNVSYGVMKYDLNDCRYTLVMLGMKKKTKYQWKITLNNTWVESYGCLDQNHDEYNNCDFRTNSEGAVRFIVQPAGSVYPILSTDFEVAECNDGICEPGEGCETCPEDCGYCPPAVCGDNICEGDENCTNCPKDCGRC